MKRIECHGRHSGLNRPILKCGLRRFSILTACVVIIISTAACHRTLPAKDAADFDKESSGAYSLEMQEYESVEQKDPESTESDISQVEIQAVEETEITDPQPADSILQKAADNEKQVLEIFKNMTTEEKVAQLFVITPEQLTGYSRITEAGNATRQAIEKYPVGGLIFFSVNLEEESRLKQTTQKLQEYALELEGLPLFLSIDEEGGSIARLANSEYFHLPQVPDMCEIGKSQDTGRAYEAGNTIGAYLSEFGFNMDFAPVADVLTNSKNTVVKTRSFGADPDLVTNMVNAYLEGLTRNNVYGVPKHFPGHGSTERDSHWGFAFSSKTWEELEKSDLKPFYSLVKEKVPFIMVGHISLPKIIGDDTPASLSPKVVQGYLRQKMGYEGVVITDALNMGAIEKHYSSGQASVMAIKAGADILLMPSDFEAAYQAVITAVEEGEISESILDEAVLRILRVKVAL